MVKRVAQVVLLLEVVGRFFPFRGWVSYASYFSFGERERWLEELASIFVWELV